MRTRARCNRRKCQARRTFAKPLEQYVKWPVCHVCKMGKMYVDKFRTSKREREIQPLCSCDGVPWSIRNSPHRVGTNGCKKRDEHLLDLAFIRGTLKHSPHSTNATIEPGF